MCDMSMAFSSDVAPVSILFSHLEEVLGTFLIPVQAVPFKACMFVCFSRDLLFKFLLDSKTK